MLVFSTLGLVAVCFLGCQERGEGAACCWCVRPKRAEDAPASWPCALCKLGQTIDIQTECRRPASTSSVRWFISGRLGVGGLVAVYQKGW